MSFKVGDRVRWKLNSVFTGTVVDVCRPIVFTVGVLWDGFDGTEGMDINSLELIESKPSMPVYNGTFDIYDSMYIRSVYK